MRLPYIFSRASLLERRISTNVEPYSRRQLHGPTVAFYLSIDTT